MGQGKSKAPLCFFEMDIERRCGFSNSAGTFAHPWLRGVVAAVLTVALFSNLDGSTAHLLFRYIS